MFSKMKIGVRIYLINGIATLSMIGIMLLGAHYLETAISRERTNQTKTIVETAASLTSRYVERVKTGELTVDDAKKRALNALSNLRYNGDNYVWVNDADGKVLWHPIAKMLGTSLLELRDAKGVMPFANMLSDVKQGAGAQYQYYWPPNETAKLKMSYVKGIPEWGWSVASGIFMDDAAKEVWKAKIEMGEATAILVIIALLIAMLIGRSITKPMQQLTVPMKRLAEGDLTTEITGRERGDEIGVIAKAVDAFKQYLLEKNRQQLADQEALQAGAEAQRRKILQEMTDKFDKSVSVFLSVLSGSMDEMRATAGGLKQLADTGLKKSSALEGATTAATENVSNVASASEEMLASVREIAAQIDKSSAKSREAVDQTQKAGASISELKALSDKIGEISKLIQNIAEQTNLLALNATIEAARAGDAGKGFAVVASEVKALASQTGRATEEIETQISSIQAATEEAVKTITSVSGIVSQVNEVATTVASAMEEQAIAIADIVRNTQSAADRTKEASEIAAIVAKGASETQTSSADIDTAAGALTKKTEDLRGSVEVFLAHLKATQ
ncbi:MAG: cache domain-containing protein [Alphaproteobacteria bacterium]|nr:cache domain-containing protein [Alphaproteobacteria bacterium]